MKKKVTIQGVTGCFHEAAAKEYFAGEDIIKKYNESQVAVLCNPSDRIDIILSDNYRRKYRVKTDLTIGMLGQSNGSSIF